MSVVGLFAGGDDDDDALWLARLAIGRLRVLHQLVLADSREFIDSTNWGPSTRFEL